LVIDFGNLAKLLAELANTQNYYLPTMLPRSLRQHFLPSIRATPMSQNLRPPLLSTFLSHCPRSCFSTQPAEPATAVDFIDSKELGKTLIFGKTWCGFSNQAKSFLEQQGATYTAVELDLRGDGADIQMELTEITGQRTVPSVWIAGEFVGGCSELMAIDRQELAKMLKEAGSLEE
jgi:glutaredoxin 3